MNNIELDKVLKEIEKLQLSNEDKIPMVLRTKDSVLVENAIKAVAFMETLNEKQRSYFEYLQLKKPVTAQALVFLQVGEELSDEQIHAVLEEANNDSANLISSKQIRFNLAQETILNYLAQREHKSMASYVRDTLIDKINNYLKKQP